MVLFKPYSPFKQATARPHAVQQSLDFKFKAKGQSEADKALPPGPANFPLNAAPASLQHAFKLAVLHACKGGAPQSETEWQTGNGSTYSTYISTVVVVK